MTLLEVLHSVGRRRLSPLTWAVLLFGVHLAREADEARRLWRELTTDLGGEA